MIGMRQAAEETDRRTSVRVGRAFVPRSILPFLALTLAGAIVLTAGRLESTAGKPSTIRPVPADLFIQSVVSRDGKLGWHQLCAPVRSQLSSAELTKTAQGQKARDAAAAVTLTWAYIATRPIQQGGALRFYLITAHWPGGATDHRTYTVHTDATGCVEDVQTS